MPDLSPLHYVYYIIMLAPGIFHFFFKRAIIQADKYFLTLKLAEVIGVAQDSAIQVEHMKYFENKNKLYKPTINLIECMALIMSKLNK